MIQKQGKSEQKLNRCLGMKLPDWAKHMIGGGLLSVVIGRVVEDYTKHKDGLSENQKKLVIGTGAGIGGGSLVGYYIGDKVIDGNNHDSAKKKFTSTLIGAASGGILGYFIAEKLGGYNKKDNNNPALTNTYEKKKEEQEGGDKKWWI